MLRHTQTIALLTVLFGAAGTCCGEKITVRLIDGKSGKPLSNLQVVIYGSHKSRALPIVSEGDVYKLDVTGEEQLQFGEARSSTHRVVKFVPCQSETLFADVKQIVRNGSASLNRCSKRRYQVRAGELVIFLRRETWRDRWKDFG